MNYYYAVLDDDGTFKPVGRLQVADITTTAPADPQEDGAETNYLPSLSAQPMTLTFTVKNVRRRQKRRFLIAAGFKRSEVTEFLFPRKKRRATARRWRRVKRLLLDLMECKPIG